MSLKIDEMEEKVILEKLLGSNGRAGDPNLLSEAVNPAMLDHSGQPFVPSHPWHVLFREV